MAVTHFLTARRLPICNASIRVGGHGLGTENRVETTCRRCLTSLAKADARRAAKAAREIAASRGAAVQIDEQITRAEWDALPRDRKTITSGIHRVLRLDRATQATILVTVEIV